eukprot:637493-Prorocentrum_minimum.AAC.1
MAVASTSVSPERSAYVTMVAASLYALWGLSTRVSTVLFAGGALPVLAAPLLAVRGPPLDPL